MQPNSYEIDRLKMLEELDRISQSDNMLKSIYEDSHNKGNKTNYTTWGEEADKLLDEGLDWLMDTDE